MGDRLRTLKDAGRRVVRALPHGRGGDDLYWTTLFTYAHGRWPRRPEALFNDYLYSLKRRRALLDPVRRFTSDKYHVKQYVAGVLGPGYTPETLGVFEDVAALDGKTFDGPCILKPTHASGSTVFLERPPYRCGPAELDRLGAALRADLYREHRELNYRGLRRRIICERLVTDRRHIKDYKVFCYGGRPKLVQVDWDRHGDHRRTIFTAGWEPLAIRYAKPRGPEEARPAALSEMLDTAKALAQDFDSVRVDFYLVRERLFVGELTHCPEQGHGRFGSLAEEELFSSYYFG